jgi:hypothetical protein
MTRISLLLILVLSGLTLACGGDDKLDIEAVPIGAEVAVTRDDGGVVRGTLAERSEETVKLDAGMGVRSVPRTEIADVQLVTESTPVVLPESAKFMEYTLPAGTELTVTLNTAVHSKSNRLEDAVEAALTAPIVRGDVTVVPVGSLLKGEVTAVEPAGKVSGRASLALRFRTLTIIDHDEPYDVDLGMSRLAAATKADDAAKIGVPAVAGGVIGGLLGGRKGAVAGAVIGGGAGTAVVMTTAGNEIDLPVGSTLTMKLDQPVEIRVPIGGR